MGNYGNKFPFALVEDILLRLPVESLVRFRCVCKSWFSLFKNQAFISRHLSSSSTLKHHNSNYYLLLRLWLTPYTHQLFSLLTNEEVGFSLKQIFIAMPKIRINLSHHLVSNPCNGLVCLYSDFSCGRDVFLCNPATREVRFLPPSNLVTKVQDGMVLGVGMGHDSSKTNNDVKVVRLWDSYSKCHCKKYIFEEYGLGSDSWRTIESANPYCCEFDTSCFALHFKGVYYWWAKLKDSTTPIVVTLNVGGGMLQKLHLPNHIDISSEIGRYLGVLNDSVSLVCRGCGAENANLDIWVMKCGVGIWGFTWAKLRTIENTPCVPLVFWKRNELLVKMFDMLKSYSVDTEDIHNVNIEVEGHGIADICEAIFCVKSLISVKGRN